MESTPPVAFMTHSSQPGLAGASSFSGHPLITGPVQRGTRVHCADKGTWGGDRVRKILRLFLNLSLNQIELLKSSPTTSSVHCSTAQCVFAGG